MVHNTEAVAVTTRKTLPWLIIALVLYAGLVLYMRDVSIDDVGISYRYAKHLAEGRGLTWNVEGPRVEGYSNFLWVVILAGARTVGFDIDLSARVCGAVCGGLSLVLLWVLLRRLWNGLDAWYLGAALLAVALNSAWVMWHLSGLEIGLYGLALLAAFLALAHHRAPRIGLLAGSLTVLTLTRPEGIVIAFTLVAVGAIVDRREGLRALVKSYGVPILCAVLAAVGLVFFRLAYYGRPMPNTVYAKFSLAFPSATQVRGWVIFVVPFLACAIYALRRPGERDRRRALAAALAAIVVQTVVVLPVNPVMNFLHRYFVAFVPLAVLPLPIVLDGLHRWRRWVGAAATAAFLIWSAQSWSAVRHNYAAQKYASQRQRCVADRLLSLPDRPRIAVGDAGRIPYWTDLPAIDTWGLCDSRIASEGFSPEIVLSGTGGPPDVYIMSLKTSEGVFFPPFGNDIMMFDNSKFQRTYRQWVLCSGPLGDRPISTNPYWFLDYGIFMNIDWARRHGIPLRDADSRADVDSVISGTPPGDMPSGTPRVGHPCSRL